MPTLDYATIHLCTILSSVAFGTLFAALWLVRERGVFYLLCGAGAFTYAATLAGFAMPGRGVGLATLLCVGVGAYNSYVLAALRCFHGRRAVSGLVLALPLLSGAAYLLVAIGPGGIPAARVANSVVLCASTIVVGVLFLRTKGARAPRSQRIVGIIHLAYVPSYVASVVLDLAGAGGRDWLSLVPLLSDQVLLGVLNVALLSMPGERAEADLRELALRDPLTGAWNRAGLDRIGRDAGTAMEVILFDIDHFKQLNDRDGHAAGDEVLRSLATKVMAALPDDAHLVRLGGDEFAALLPSGQGTARAPRLADTLRRVARDDTPCTISVGVARTASGTVDLADAFERADQMLYRAKRAGRDRVSA